jgi:hypothetical protein
MAAQNESERHVLLKEFAGKKLRDVFDVPQESIELEFPLGNARYDVAAYPPVDAMYLPSVGVECGRKKSTRKENEKYFEQCLRYIDMVLWLPYSIYESSFADLMLAPNENIVTLPVNFDIHNEQYSHLANIAMDKEVVAGLMIADEERYLEFDG